MTSYKVNIEPHCLGLSDEPLLAHVLFALGNTLKKLTVRTSCTAAKSWVKVLVLKARPISELS